MVATLTQEQQTISAALVMKILELGHNVSFIKDNISEGPIVSIYRFLPRGTTKVSHLENMSEDFAITLGVESILVKRIPGESCVSIWVPNKERKYVNWRDTIGNFSKVSKQTAIPLNLGVDHLGRPSIQDLSSLPHLLIAGATGSGKSTLLASILASLIYSKSSDEVKLAISDTKGVDFGHFIGAPHLLHDVATTVYQTLEMMDWLIEEMNRRLKLIAQRGVRNVKEYNQSNYTDTKNNLPYVAFVIDELADLLGDSSRASSQGSASIGKASTQKLASLAQKARASGIHIIAATQRPSVRVVTGDIKANFPSRLCFRVPSGIDSRVVLDTQGAERLLQWGDTLFIDPAKPGLHRLHAPIADINDIKAAVEVATRREQI